MRDAIASPPPTVPHSAPRHAAPQSFGRSLVAPFAVGVFTAYFWAQVRLWLALALEIQRVALWLRTFSPVLLVVAVMLLFIAVPAVVMLVSLVGDRRLMDAGRGGQIATWTGLAIALIALFLLGDFSRIQFYMLISGSLTQDAPLNSVAYQIIARLPTPGVPAIPVGLAIGFTIGLAAAYALSRWATGSLARQLARWLAVGALAGFGAGIVGTSQTLAFWLAYIIVFHPTSLGESASLTARRALVSC